MWSARVILGSLAVVAFAFFTTLWGLNHFSSTQEGIRIITATYGANCSAPIGNATNATKASCDGKFTCSYAVDTKALGDPAPGCGKDFRAEYECLPGRKRSQIAINPEAGLGSVASFVCAK